MDVPFRRTPQTNKLKEPGATCVDAQMPVVGGRNVCTAGQGLVVCLDRERLGSQNVEKANSLYTTLKECVWGEKVTHQSRNLMNVCIYYKGYI